MIIASSALRALLVIYQSHIQRGLWYNSRFSADVINLCKLGVRHVGGHGRCEIICKSMPFLSLQIIAGFHMTSLNFKLQKY